MYIKYQHKTILACQMGWKKLILAKFGKLDNKHTFRACSLCLEAPYLLDIYLPKCCHAVHPHLHLEEVTPVTSNHELANRRSPKSGRIDGRHSTCQSDDLRPPLCHSGPQFCHSGLHFSRSELPGRCLLSLHR